MEPLEQFEVDVLCVGHAAFDLTMQVDHHPGPDEKCFASSLTECGGGPAANAAIAVARLGGSSAFAGYLGDDLYGRRHYAELAFEGVDTGFVVLGPHPTPLSLILVKPDGRRTVVNYKVKTPPLDTGEVDFSRCRPKAILFDGHEPEISLPLARIARAGGIPTILDAGSVHRGTVELAREVEFLMASERFAGELTLKPDHCSSLDELSGVAPFAAITLGEQGLVWKSGQESGALAAFRVDALDTTGAGDIFHGAFALGIAEGLEISDALRFASAAAAISCTKIGARLSAPTRAEVEEFLCSNP